MSKTAHDTKPGFNSSVFTGVTTGPAMSTRSNFFGNKKASADMAYMRATASSYIIAEKSPANKIVDNAAKPSIKVTDLHHDEAIKY
jgi:hypothetical protein